MMTPWWGRHKETETPCDWGWQGAAGDDTTIAGRFQISCSSEKRDSYLANHTTHRFGIITSIL